MKWFLFFVLIIGISITYSYSAFSPTKNSSEKVEKNISIGWVGDMVPAESDEFNNSAFLNVKELTQNPSLMIGNLEGTFANESRVSKCLYITTKCHAFRGGESFAYALKDAGFDFVTLINNHSYDYGDRGLSDTELVLNNLNIPFISQTKPFASIKIKDKNIGILGVSSTPPQRTINDYDFINKKIIELKKENDIVILIFHGGSEGSDKTIVTGQTEYLGSENRGNVELTAKTAIDAGADIVLGSGPHVLRKVEFYNNKPIVYSAGNFVGGNQRLTTTGILGVSALFTISQKNSVFYTDIRSIMLSKEGTPFSDPDNKANVLIDSLSK